MTRPGPKTLVLGITALHHLADYLQEWTDCDSIDTVERMYTQAESGAWCCCWPDCQTRHHDPVAMWRHIHFTRHGLSFGRGKPEQVWRALADAGWPEDRSVVAGLLGMKTSST